MPLFYHLIQPFLTAPAPSLLRNVSGMACFSFTQGSTASNVDSPRLYPVNGRPAAHASQLVMRLPQSEVL